VNLMPIPLPDSLEQMLGGLKQVGDQWIARCPLHEDNTASMTVRVLADGKVLVKCHAGCDQNALVAALNLHAPERNAEWTPSGDAIAVYDYRDETGTTLFQVVRTATKNFQQRRPDPSAKSGWTWNLTGTRRVLFRLPELIAAVSEGRNVSIAEGEKDVLSLVAEGEVATCNPGGAGKWKPEYAEYFRDVDVTIFADKDKAGRTHAHTVAASLQGIASRVRIVEAADPHKDIAAHLAAGLPMSVVVTTQEPRAAETETRPIRPALDEAAYQGLVGRVVRAVEPHTEADPAALVFTFLAAVGAMLDRSAYVLAGDAEHAARIWPLIIGKTAGGLKGTSWSAIARIILAADPSFANNIDRGLSTGEGLIERVRDGHGEPDYKDFDEGVTDKRLLILESEFAAVLGKAKRDGNVLSETMRQAYDGVRLSTLTRKANRLSATGAHIVIIGHITPTELRNKLSDSDVTGGLMNRFLPVHSERSKKLPDGGSTPKEVVETLGRELATAVKRAGATRGQVTRDEAASDLWRSVYDQLTPEVPDGALASVIARAVPQVLRLSLIYARLDEHHGEVRVRIEHLEAALAAWRYIEASARLTFGDLQTNRDLNKLAAGINAAGKDGLTRDQIRDLFDRHKNRDQLDELLRQLTTTGRYMSITEPTGGRSATRYLATVERDKRDKRSIVAGSTLKPTEERITALTALTALPPTADVPMGLPDPGVSATTPTSSVARDHEVDLNGAGDRPASLRRDLDVGTDAITTTYGPTEPSTVTTTVDAADVAIPATTGFTKLSADLQVNGPSNADSGSGNPQCRRCGRNVLYRQESIERGICARCVDELAKERVPQ
jgi:hypothetical protein